MTNQKIKTSTIFFIIGVFLFVAFLFMFAVPQDQFGTGYKDFSLILEGSPITIIISIAILSILAGFIFKLWIENRK